jgi:hypothetical protein
MKNAIFIHAANMDIDYYRQPNVGRCQEILDRISFFINESKIYEDVDFIRLVYTGNENLTLNVKDKGEKIYAGPNVYQWEFPTLTNLCEYCKENPDANVLYLHTQGVSQGFTYLRDMIDRRRDYFLYWNIYNYKLELEKLKEYDTCGAMLVPLNADVEEREDGSSKVNKIHDNPVWHYSQNFWWSRASHINTLPDPQHYPQILDVRHQAEFWLCSSTEEGEHASVHNIYESWKYVSDWGKDKYVLPEHLGIF